MEKGFESLGKKSPPRVADAEENGTLVTNGYGQRILEMHEITSKNKQKKKTINRGVWQQTQCA